MFGEKKLGLNILFVVAVLTFISTYAVEGQQKLTHSEICSIKTSDLKASLQMQKGTDLIQENTKIPVFYLSAQGIAKGSKFRVAHRNAHGNIITFLEGIYLGDGKIKKQIKQDQSRSDLLIKSLETFEPIWIGGFMKGEPSEFLLMDSHGNVINTVSYLPHPLEAIAPDGAKLSMTYCGDTLYKFKGENFIPGEEIKIISISKSETIESSYIVEPSGVIFGTLFANVGASESQSLFTLKRKTHSLSINYFSIASSTVAMNNPIVIFTVDHLPSSQELLMTSLCYNQLFPK